MAKIDPLNVTPYPCPACIGVVRPGETVHFPRLQGAGVIAFNPSWNWPSGSLQPGVEMPPDEYIKCRRCDGTGLVADRRIGKAERRKLPAPHLRAIDMPEQGSKNYSIDAVGREGGKASTEAIRD